MDISNQDLATVKVILAAIEEWKRDADKYGSNSKESQQCGSKAMILLCRHAKTLNDFQRRFGASVITPGIILTLIDIADKFTFDEIKNRGGEDDLYLCLGQQEGFIADLKRWIEEASAPPSDLIKTCVVIKDFYVSRATLKRAIKDGILKSHRPPNAPLNGSHLFSEKDIAAHWPRIRT